MWSVEGEVRGRLGGVWSVEGEGGGVWSESRVRGWWRATSPSARGVTVSHLVRVRARVRVRVGVGDCG